VIYAVGTCEARCQQTLVLARLILVNIRPLEPQGVSVNRVTGQH